MLVPYLVLDVVQWLLDAMSDALLRVLRLDAGMPRRNDDVVWY